MILDVEDNPALMIPEEEVVNENDHSYPNGALAGQTAQDTSPMYETWASLEEVES